MGWNAIWDAHNVVCFGANKAIFEYVNDDLTSVSSKFISPIWRPERYP